jgi:hypothetical protein
MRDGFSLDLDLGSSSSAVSFLSFALSSSTDFLLHPRHEIEISSTSENTTPEHELGCVDYHAKNVELWLED